MVVPKCKETLCRNVLSRNQQTLKARYVYLSYSISKFHVKKTKPKSQVYIFPALLAFCDKTVFYMF